MAKTIRAALVAVAGAALLAGCATGPYYQDGYGNGYYDNGYGYGPSYYEPAYGPMYYEPGYVAPSVGFGVTYIDRGDDRRHWRERDGRREWRGDNRGADAVVRQQMREERQVDRNDAERNARLGAGG